MPIYIEISTLHRTVTIVARGSISPDEIRGAAQQMFEAKVPHFAKLVDVAGAVTEVNLQQIQAIGLSPQFDIARTGRRGDREGSLQLVLEQAFDDRNGSLGFHAKHRFTKASRRRRPEESRSFERGFPFRQWFEGAIDDIDK